jgi:alkylation response protein AidB-like acyl-CoA dehydrogenase
MNRSSEFFQEPPRLENQYRDDRVLQSFLRRVLPPEVRCDIEPSLDRMGELAGGPLYALSLRHRREEPEHVPFDAWGQRVDEVRVNAAWPEYARVATEEGVVATAYERVHGSFSRIHQFALAYLFERSSQLYSCPLAMTDGCARTLELLAPPAVRDRVLQRLISRDPAHVWTSGQWMTERIGGSDVGVSETVARRASEGWILYGTKWFTSAVTSQVALTLARPEGNGPGGKGLALFLVELRDVQGRLNGITLLRLKEKLGTRNLPTAELRLEGTPAEPVCGLSDGVRNMATMLNLTRTWNAVSAAASLRRGATLARDYARRRIAFGAPLAEKPLHLETLADHAAEQEAAFLLAFHVVTQLGRQELDELGPSEEGILRALHPVAKLVTARQAVVGASEVLEAFGGAGYVEDTGLPELLRDAQVLPIWEGTTNVLALETYRALQRTDALRALIAEIIARVAVTHHAVLLEPARVARTAAERAEAWWQEAERRGAWAHEASARRFAFTLGRTLALALLVEHAQWALDAEGDARSAEAARRFARAGVDCLAEPEPDPQATTGLALDEPLPSESAR